HGREPQAAAREFGTKERVEDPGANFFRHSGAIVLDFEYDVPARFGAVREELLIGKGGDGFAARDHPHLTTAAFPDRFGAVDDQVHDDLLQLARIHKDGRQVRSEGYIDTYRPGNR